MSAVTPETNDAPKGADILPIKPDYNQWKGLNVKEENIPDSLRDIPQWVMWKAEPKKDGGYTKPPRTMQGESASSTDPATWTDYDSAVSAYEKDQKRSEKRRHFSGIGFVITKENNLVGIDFDHIRDPDTGTIKPEYKAQIDALDTYQEVSPSGTGIRVICTGELPEGTNSAALEMYDSGRYLTLTGHALNDKEVEPIVADKLKALRDHYSPVQAVDDLSTIAAAIDANRTPAKPLEVLMALTKINPDRDYQTWLKVGMALKVEGFPVSYWIDWSRNDIHGNPSEKFDGEQTLRDKWDSFKKSDITIGTLFYLAGVKEKVKVFSKPQPIGLNALTKEPEPPPMLIDGLMSMDAFGFVGPGGVAKTTLMLLVMIHVILGRKVWGQEIEQSGPCLFVSAEDNAESMTYRINRLCRGLNLSEEELQKVSADLFVHDLTGQMLRFVEADAKGNLTITEHVDDLIGVYKDKGIKLVCCDPAVYFGPGERFVNDAEAALMQAARRISIGLGRVAAGYIHHTGKEAAKNQNTDQYAGRGGSAFADNSRVMWNLYTCETRPKGKRMPKEIYEEDMKDNRVAYLTVAKLSHAKRPRDSFWIKRSEFDGFAFDLLDTPMENAKEAEEALKIKEQNKKLTVVTAVWNAIKEAVDRGEYPTKNVVREEVDIKSEGVGIGKTRVAALIDLAVQRGFLEMEDMPEGLKQGARKHYLNPVKKPFIGAGGL